MVRNNVYGHLIRQADVEQLRVTGQTKSLMIVNRSNESVRLLLQEAMPGKWIYGYVIYLENGREISRKPSLEYGCCVSENDAILHFLGLILSLKDIFSAEAIEIVNEMLGRKAQLNLFS